TARASHRRLAPRPPRGVDAVRRRRAVEEIGELDERPPVEDRRRDVVARDLLEVRLGQMDPERVIVERLRTQQRVAVVVDDRDRIEIEPHSRARQYLKKWLSSSNCSSCSAYAAASARRTLRYSVARPDPRAFMSTSSRSSS